MEKHGSSCHLENPKLLDSAEGVQWRNFHFGQAKLQYSTRTSILLAAFGMEIMTSFQFTNPSHPPSWLVSLLSVNSVVLIALNSFAFVIGTCLLPHFKAAEEEYVPPQEGQLKMNHVPLFSPHEKFSGFIKNSHKISHIFGLFVFLLEVPLVVSVKFWDLAPNAAIASTVAMFPFLAAFLLFYWYFNYEYSIQIYGNRRTTLDEVEKQYHRRYRESLKRMETISIPEIEVQEEQVIETRRHSLHNELCVVNNLTPTFPKRNFPSLHNMHLEPVEE